LSSASKKKRRRRRHAPPSATASQAAADGGTGTKTAPRPVRGAPDDERPPAPWGSFPLVELVVLVGIGMIVAGFVVGLDEPRGQTIAGTGLALASLAGLELSIREHFAGFRSHTTLLASAAAVATLAALYYLAELSAGASLAGAALVGAAAAALLLRTFRNRSGGRSFKVK
jgi:hypothetical protein